MNFPRRQHNATILPDGTVLVTGGGGGGPPGSDEAFNNLSPGQPVHIAELWDPQIGQWTMLAAEQTDRCYHSTAVLLPDGRVLSAGGGEFILNEGTPRQVANSPQNTHYDAQLFSPPYLFKGPQPQITSAPDSVQYSDHIRDRHRPAAADRDLSLIRLSSVTHSFNAGQRINFLPFQVTGGTLTVTAPPNANVCPPGHYMLFILDQQGVRRSPSRPGLSASLPPQAERLESPTSLHAGRRATGPRRRVRPAGRGTGRGTRHPRRGRDHGNLPVWHRGLLGRRERGAAQPGRSAVC